MRLREVERFVAFSTLAWILAFSTHGMGQDASKALTVAAKLQAKTAYIGQAIELQVAVVAGARRPEVGQPKLAGADLAFIGVETQAITVSAIEEQVNEQTVYRFRYRLIPRKAGVLAIPAITAKLDAQRVASTPIAMKVKELPREGRTSDFLGGVGAFELNCSATPGAIRLGQEFEYRIEVKGTAARGMRDAPSLDRLRRAQPGARLEKLADATTDEPPARVFTWRIRPKSSGELRLPPVSIAAFDNKLGRYTTKATASLAVRVVDVPRFDPKSIVYRADATVTVPRVDRSIGWIRPLGLIGVIGLLTSAIAWRWSRRRTERGVALEFMRRIEERLKDRVEGRELGPLINQIVKEYLVSRRAWSTGALTPLDARDAVARLPRSNAFSERAERLIEQCDRLGFSGREEEEDLAAIKRDALGLIEGLIQAELGGNGASRGD